jgi:general secretion pathway protein F
MPAYRFEALDAAGKSSSGLLEADNAKAARAQLRARELVPLAVTPVTAATTDGSAARFTGGCSRAHARRLDAAAGRAWWVRACRWSAR